MCIHPPSGYLRQQPVAIATVMPLCISFASAVCGMVFACAAAASARSTACADDDARDWMVETTASGASSAPIRPADRAIVEQTPPDFTWPDHGPDARYEFNLTFPQGVTRRRITERNWFAWDEPLPLGRYQWRVRVLTKSGANGDNGTAAPDGLQSRARRFEVSATAMPFVVPDWTVLLARARAAPRPRALPNDRSAFLAALQTERRDGLARLLAEVKRASQAPASPPTAPARSQVRADAHTACLRTLNSAFAWIATRQEERFRDALRRARNLASWDPHGSTAYANGDEAAREIAWTLTLAYDWLSPRLDAEQRSALLAALRVRVGDIDDDVIGRRARVAIHPFDSHGNHTLTYLAAMSVLLAGDLAEAQNWLRDALPLAIHWTSPWGGEDGGFANGTAYAQWDTGDKLVAWYVLRWAVGIDMARKAWVSNYARFLAYFLPPGAPAGVFGDGAEQHLAEAWARFGKGYASFAPSPLARWYAAQLNGEDPARLELLLAPRSSLRRADPTEMPANTPDAALFPSIGWVAMHSRLADPARVSVYFKSSPYGSFNHSHADQNSFVIDAGGQRLAIDSGYYDGYDTPHWRQWYKQTRAHNAITFDGGNGQVVFEEGGQLGRGAITRFEHHIGYDIVTADATPAYGGALTRAERTLVYQRPNLVLVYDVLASPQARRWEWNVHAAHRMESIGERRVRIRNGEAALCVEMLEGQATEFTQTERFTAEPQGDNLAAQWHGAFVSRNREATAEFVALLRVSCTNTPVSARRADCGWTVQADGRQMQLCRGRVAVEPRP
jgi:hypothetical protein